jgi:hypothetical protein
MSIDVVVNFHAQPGRAMAENIVGSGHFAKILELLVAPPDNGVIEEVD